MADTCYTGVTKNILWTARIMFTRPALCKTLCGQAHFFSVNGTQAYFFPEPQEELRKAWQKSSAHSSLSHFPAEGL